MFPTYHDEIPYVTTEQMIEVDRAMIEYYKIELIQMMENAGHHLACLVRNYFFDGDINQKKVFVLVGSGGNGGGALVSARHLHNSGADIQVYLTRPANKLARVTAKQHEILRRMGLPILQVDDIFKAGQPDLIIDGLIGYNLHGAPRGIAADLINWANQQSTPVLSLDVPSGLNSTTGELLEPAIRATATMTLALPKQGFLSPAARALVGELFLADISVPSELYASLDLGLDVPKIFARGDIVRLP